MAAENINNESPLMATQGTATPLGLSIPACVRLRLRVDLHAQDFHAILHFAMMRNQNGVNLRTDSFKRA
jgi:hypothetical protein